jgi:REP element-mobilizing transposase RayT
MPRGRRVLVEGGLYHVYNRFARGEDVFADPEEAVEFAELLREVKRRDDLTVYAWALLSNHFHIALRTSVIPLSRTMQRLQGGYAKRFNRRWGRSGPLWQSRYQARVIDSQDYCEQVILYIHLNPVRARLVEDPVEHVFCGHRELVKRTREPLVDVDHALISFGSTLKEARRSYKARIRVGMDQRPSGEWEGIFGLFGPRDRDLEAPEPIHTDELGRSTGRERPTLDAMSFLKAACSILDVETARLTSSRRDRETAVLRKLIVAVGIERWGQRAAQLAVLLNKHPVAVSRWVSDAARQRQEEPALREEMESLDEALSIWALDACARGEFAQETGAPER